MKTSWWLLGWAVLCIGPGMAHAQHGGHGAGHVGGIAPAHFYGGSGGMHAPPPMHSPPVHLPPAPAMHLPASPGMNSVPHVHAGPHLPAAGVPATNQAIQLEAARLAALESHYASGYPGFYVYYGLSGVPYYHANHLYGYGYNYGNGHGYGYYPRPYYYGYLSGVPYINSYNYSPVYYSLYNDLPGMTGSVTTLGVEGTADSQAAGESAEASASEDPFVGGRNVSNLTSEQARAALTRAEQDLAAGKYQQAVQNAGKAAIQLHEESAVHEVLWLALMGLADYRGAAIEAHAVDHFGVTPSWNDVAMKHADPARFNEQMKKLETFVQRNKDSDFAAFLLGYNYLVLGHKDAAKQWLEIAAKMDPQDVLCAKLVNSLQADSNTAKPTVGLLPSEETPAS